MQYNFRLLTKEEIPLIDELAKSVNLDEKIDYNCDFIGAFNGSTNLLGIAGVNLKKHYPQFEHIIICKDKQKTLLGFLLMKKIEEYLKLKKIAMYVSYIRNDRKYMQNYAEKWGMKIYNHKLGGKWYFKEIKGDNYERSI
jgi:hypothetical protein